MKMILSNEFFRFCVVGGINTVATYIIFLFLLKVSNYSLAYSVAYIIGIFVSFYLNSLFVFNSQLCWSKFMKFPLVYLIQYIIGLIFLAFFVEFVKLGPEIGMVLVIVLSIPITFFLSKYFLTNKLN